MKTIASLNPGILRFLFTPRRLVSIFCFLALLAFPGGSFAASRITNLATRANVGTGNDNVILGTILVGSGSVTLIFRGIGPTLEQYFPGAALADPNLQIFDSNGSLIGSNNNWQDDPGQAAAIQGAGLAPLNANESAYWIQLGAGAYSAVLTGVGGGTGIGVVEVYDITSQPSSIKLANVSTRANSGTGNNTEVFGITIQGGNKSIALRGLGPSLALYFSGTLANPALSLRNKVGTQIQFNQNWTDTPAQYDLIQGYGFDLPNGLESGMITQNLNGTYTVVMDTSGGSGISVIEAYDLGERLGYATGSGASVCNNPGGIYDLSGSGPFTVPAGTAITLRYRGWASQYSCPQCPASPSCGAATWSMDAVLTDQNNAVIPITNSGTGTWTGQCTTHFKSTTWTVPNGYTLPYLFRIRGHSSAACFSPISLNVDYHVLNGP